jgi:hypothetical protein
MQRSIDDAFTCGTTGIQRYTWGSVILNFFIFGFWRKLKGASPFSEFFFDNVYGKIKISTLPAGELGSEIFLLQRESALGNLLP